MIFSNLLRKKSAPAQRKARKNSRSSKSLTARIIAAGDRLAFAWPVRESMYRHLSVQIGNGVTVETALDTFRARLQRRKKISSDKIVADVSRRMRNGDTLTEALSNWIPQDETSTISSGELAGNLPRSLDLVIETKQRVERVYRSLRSAMISPVVYAFAIYAMLWAIGKFVIPGLQQVLPIERAQGLVYGLFVSGDFANSWWAIVPPIAVLIAIAVIIYSLPRWTGRFRIAAEKMFPFSFYRDTQGYIWLMGFLALLRAGMADVEILKRQAKIANPWLKERLNAFHWRMDNGLSLPKALLTTGKNRMPGFDFPSPDMIDDIASMEGFGDFPERLSKLAVQWSEELERITMERAKTFGFAMEIIMYLVMGILMIAINEMSVQIGNIPGM